MLTRRSLLSNTRIEAKAVVDVAVVTRVEAKVAEGEMEIPEARTTETIMVRSEIATTTTMEVDMKILNHPAVGAVDLKLTRTLSVRTRKRMVVRTRIPPGEVK